MSENKNTKLVNAHGEPIKSTTMRLPIAARNKTVLTFIKYYLQSPDNQQFITTMAPFATVTPEGNIAFSANDEVFQAACLTYGSHDIINKALDEDLTDAYKLLLELTDLPEYKKDNSLAEITTDDIDLIYDHYAMVPEMQTAVEMCRIQGDITCF